MESRDKCERELEKYIDSLMEKMDGMYCADLTESAKIESRMNDIRLRDDIISQIKEEIRCKKICERIKAEQEKEATYSINVKVCRNGIQYTVAR